MCESSATPCSPAAIHTLHLPRPCAGGLAQELVAPRLLRSPALGSPAAASPWATVPSAQRTAAQLYAAAALPVLGPLWYTVSLPRRRGRDLPGSQPLCAACYSFSPQLSPLLNTLHR